jgi:hypothetical protein
MAPRATSIPGSKSVKVRYGPYKVPNMGHKNALGEAGALWNYPDKQIEKPCEECIIVGINAGLEYPDGKTANIDSNMWLHHASPVQQLIASKTKLTHTTVRSIRRRPWTLRCHLRQ